MDIHKPKPVHNLREFASEIVVIVIGVLIALGLEQAVEAWHWAHEVEQERVALLRQEDDAQQSFVLRKIQQDCIDRRLEQLETIFRRQQAGLPLGIVGPLGRPFRAGVAVGSWQIALAGQGLAHMPLKEKVEFDNVFSSFGEWNNVAGQEQQVWTRLSLIDHHDLLNDQDWSTLRSAYAEASAISKRFRQNFPAFIPPKYQSIKDTRQLEMTPTYRTAYETSLRAMCTPMIAP